MNQTENYFEQIIKEGFDPKLIIALFKNFSDQYTALFELIDNAVDDMIEGRKLLIAINYDENNKKMVVKNVNGRGMTFKDLEKFFMWGLSEKEARIGRYGQGGKAALGYLARSFIIKSHPIGKEESYVIKVDDWENREKGLKEFKIERISTLSDTDKGWVAIEISDLKKRFSENTIKEKIKDTYRPLIMQNKIEFYFNNELLNCLKINYDQDTIRFFSRNLPYPINGKIYTISGEYGIVSDPKSPRGGFNIYHYGRKIAKKEYFGHTDPSRRWNVEKLYGELYIDFDIPLLMNKTDFDRDSPIWIMIEKTMHEELKDIMKLVIDYRLPTVKEQNIIKKVEQKVKNTEIKHNIAMKLSNYGHDILFKIKNQDNKTMILINRDHIVYQIWSSTNIGKKLYAIMIYSLYTTTVEMKKKEASIFLKKFSDSLKKNTEILLK